MPRQAAPTKSAQTKPLPRKPARSAVRAVKSAPSVAERMDEEVFIQKVAALLIPMGMPPIAARMNGYLILSKDPLTLDELAAGLDISKSSASVAARLLERYGVIQRLSEQGTKRGRYVAADRSAGFLAEQSHFLGAMSSLLNAWAVANPRGDVSARMKEMGVFYRQVHDAIEKVIRDNSPHSQR